MVLGSKAMIPVLKVKLPPEEEINCFIKEIDRNNVYSNFGPLNQQLSTEIGKKLGVEVNSVLLTSWDISTPSRTSSLYLGIKKIDPNREILIGVPAWTFAATVQSVISLGIRPVLIDVDHNGYMSKDEVDKFISQGNKLDIIIPVLPFGSCNTEEEWDEYAAKTGIKVVIDAAASIFTLRPTKSIAAVSLHVTKGISSGEGGFLVSKDQKLVSKLKERINFGFSSSRISEVIGMNCKMSEYNAAIGLASIKNFSALKRLLENKNRCYHELIQLADIQDIEPYGSISARLTYNVKVPFKTTEEANHFVAKMAIDYGTEVRSWWGPSMADQPISQYCKLIPDCDYKNARQFSRQCMGIPFGEHMDTSRQEYVIKSLKSSLIY